MKTERVLCFIVIFIILVPIIALKENSLFVLVLTFCFGVFGLMFSFILNEHQKSYIITNFNFPAYIVFPFICICIAGFYGVISNQADPLYMLISFYTSKEISVYVLLIPLIKKLINVLEEETQCKKGEKTNGTESHQLHGKTHPTGSS